MYLLGCRWDLWVFILEVWSGCDFVWTGDEFVKRENAILIGNHSGGLDFVPGIVVTSRTGVGCGHMMTLMKKSLQYMPTIGMITLSLSLLHFWEASFMFSI